MLAQADLVGLPSAELVGGLDKLVQRGPLGFAIAILLLSAYVIYAIRHEKVTKSQRTLLNTFLTVAVILFVVGLVFSFLEKGPILEAIAHRIDEKPKPVDITIFFAPEMERELMIGGAFLRHKEEKYSLTGDLPVSIRIDGKSTELHVNLERAFSLWKSNTVARNSELVSEIEDSPNADEVGLTEAP